jgi:hypothetical protein
MIRRRNFTLVYILVFSAFAMHGQPGKARARVTLAIGGATVWLGMSQLDVMSEMSHAGLTATALNPRMFIVSGGTLQFTQGRLNFADRDWGENAESKLDAVIGALGTLTAHGDIQCVIQNAPLSEPEQKADRIFVTCGERSIMIMAGTALGKRASAVSERIGHFDPSR